MIKRWAVLFRNHMMPWQEPSERHSEALVDAIHNAAKLIATHLDKGFKLMADAQAQALTDLSTAVTNLGNAIAAEITALQAALTNNVPPVNDSPAIETAVTNLNNLTASLKASVAPPVVVPVLASITPVTGLDAGGTAITLTGSGFTGATGVTVGGAAATALVVVSDTTLTALTPAGTDGAQPVVVTTPAGVSVAPVTFTYIPAAASLTPAPAPQSAASPLIAGVAAGKP